jgi:hypothetical protein
LTAIDECKMASISESTLDESFAAFLAQDQRASSAGLGAARARVQDAPEEEEDALPGPISEPQKRKLFQLLSSLNYIGFDAATLERLLKINSLNEMEADHLINYAEVIKDSQFSKEVTKRIMEGITWYSLRHPEEVVKVMAEDQTMVNELNYFFGSVLAFLGKLKGPFMFASYLLFTHIKQSKQFGKLLQHYEDGVAIEKAHGSAQSTKHNDATPV